MMTEEQRFMFDVQGYLVLEKVLDAGQVEQMQADMAVQGIWEPKNQRFGGFLNWGEPWRALIDHPRLLPVLQELLGERFRLDHAYGMAMKAASENGMFGMHHHSYMFEHACFYLTHGQRMHNGLIVISYALTDIPPGAGGFCCIPGSHKASFTMPEKWYGLKDNPMVRQVPQRAGDVVIFTEALTHGTMPWTSTTGERRSVLLKYCPHYMQWADRPMNAEIEGLTERQKLILQGPHVWKRPAVAASQDKG